MPLAKWTKSSLTSSSELTLGEPRDKRAVSFVTTSSVLALIRQPVPTDDPDPGHFPAVGAGRSPVEPPLSSFACPPGEAAREPEASE